MSTETQSILDNIFKGIDQISPGTKPKVEVVAKVMPKSDEKVEMFKSQFSVELFQKLHLNEDLFDFQFTFASGERIPVQKCLLSIGSEVFRAKFNGEWKGKNEIQINDVSAGAFEEFLQFFYLNNVAFTMENVIDVMGLCKKYEMDECMTVCGHFLKPNIDDENVCWAYDIAIENNAQELKKYCEMIIGYNAEAVFASEGFKSSKRVVLDNILELMETFCFPEIVLFEACMTWVKHNSKQNEMTEEIVLEHLGDSFFKIRFGSMPVMDAGKIVRKYKSLLRLVLSSKFDDSIYCHPRKQPVTIPRWDKTDLIRFRRPFSTDSFTELERYTSMLVKNIEITTFTSNAPLLLAGFNFASICTRERDHRRVKMENIVEIPTEITIFEIDPSNQCETIVLENEEAILNHKHSESVSLSKLIFINPKFIYKIQMEQTLDREYFVNELRSIFSKVENIEINFYGEMIKGHLKDIISELHFINDRSMQ